MQVRVSVGFPYSPEEGHQDYLPSVKRKGLRRRLKEVSITDNPSPVHRQGLGYRLRFFYSIRLIVLDESDGTEDPRPPISVGVGGRTDPYPTPYLHLLTQGSVYNPVVFTLFPFTTPPETSTVRGPVRLSDLWGRKMGCRYNHTRSQFPRLLLLLGTQSETYTVNAVCLCPPIFLIFFLFCFCSSN